MNPFIGEVFIKESVTSCSAIHIERGITPVCFTFILLVVIITMFLFTFACFVLFSFFRKYNDLCEGNYNVCGILLQSWF